MTTNEAAERLRSQLGLPRGGDSPGQHLLDEALAAERRAGYEEGVSATLAGQAYDEHEIRRATVERIRVRLIGLLTTLPRGKEKYPSVRAILDEEAAR